MTLIASLVDSDKNIHMIGDSAGIDGWHSLSIIKYPKIFIRDNKYILGYTTSFRMGQILQFMKFPRKDTKMPFFEWTVSKFVPKLIAQFELAEYDYKEKGCNFLIGSQGEIFEIGNDMQVYSQLFNNGMAVGCAYQNFLGVLAGLDYFDNQFTPENKLDIAIKITKRFSAGIAPPYNYLMLPYKELR